MLEKIREGSQGIWAIVILGLVILSFVFAGVGGYITTSKEPAAATVNGDNISVSTLERAYQNERARMEAQYGESFAALAADADYLRQFRQGVLDRLIADRLIEQAAADMGLRVSDKQVRAAIAEMQEFQIGGRFNSDRFRAVIRQAGFSPSAFMQYMRAEMTRQQLVRALYGSEFALDSQAKEIFTLQRQTRDGRFLTIPAESFKEQITLSEEEMQSFYQQNLAQYDTDEMVKVAYVELQAEDVMPLVSVSEDEAEEYYANNANNYKSEEQRRVSHILIDFGDDKAAAKEEAQALLAQVEADKDFAALAEEHSDDTFSAENGGDLEWFGRDVMDPAFEEAAFSLSEEGQVSDVVESEFGFHIIKLTGIQPEQVIPFEQVKEEIMAQLKEDKAIEQFYALQQQMAEVAFEMPDSLEEVAARANVEIKETDLFTRNTAPAPIANTPALAEAFSETLIEEQVNSDVIEIDDNHVMVMRVIEHQPERTRTFEEVESIIESRLMAQKAQQAARAWAEELVASIQNGEDVTARLEEKTLDWKQESDVSRFGSSVAPAVAETLFKLGLQSNQREVAELASGDVAIVELTAVNMPEEAQEQELASLQQQLQSARSQQVLEALIHSLRSRAEIERFN